MKQTKSQLLMFDLDQTAPILAEYLSGRGVSTLSYCTETRKYWTLQVWKQYYSQILESKNEELDKIEADLLNPTRTKFELFANPDGSPYKEGPSEDGRFGIFVFTSISVDPIRKAADLRGEIKVLRRTIKSLGSEIDSEEIRVRYGSR